MTYQIGNEEITAVARIINSGALERYIDPYSSEVYAFESEFSKYLDCRNCLAVSSGTAALTVALKSLGISRGDEVIIPAYTYIATALAVLSVGAIPVVANINRTLTVDVEDIEVKITDATKAIIPVHMHGLPCEMDVINNLAKKFNLFVIEDVAQATGGSYKEKKLGTIGDIGTFSFNHHKIISCGEGGAIVCKDENIYKKANIFHHGGIFFEKKSPLDLLDHKFLGQNFRLSEISGAILCEQLKKLDSFLSKLRNEKMIFLNELKVNKSDHFILSPTNDPSGDCARVVFITFANIEMANVFLKLARKNKIDCFSAFSDGHTATCWSEILKSEKILTYEDGYLIEKELDFDISLIIKSEEILKKTVGFPMFIDRSEELSYLEAKKISELINSL